MTQQTRRRTLRGLSFATVGIVLVTGAVLVVRRVEEDQRETLEKLTSASSDVDRGPRRSVSASSVKATAGISDTPTEVVDTAASPAGRVVVRGRVVDTENRSVADASVSAGIGSGAQATGRTLSDGTFEVVIEHDADSSWSTLVWARATSESAAADGRRRVPPVGEVDIGVMVAEQRLRLDITIVDDRDQPIACDSIRVRSTTTPDAAIDVVNVAAGRYSIRESPGVYLIEAWSGSMTACDRVALDAGLFDTVRLRLHPPTPVRFMVTVAETDAPLAGARLAVATRESTLGPGFNRVEVATVSSDAEGRASIVVPSIPSRGLGVRVEAEGHEPLFADVGGADTDFSRRIPLAVSVAKSSVFVARLSPTTSLDDSDSWSFVSFTSRRKAPVRANVVIEDDLIRVTVPPTREPATIGLLSDSTRWGWLSAFTDHDKTVLTLVEPRAAHLQLVDGFDRPLPGREVSVLVATPVGVINETRRTDADGRVRFGPWAEVDTVRVSGLRGRQRVELTELSQSDLGSDDVPVVVRTPESVSIVAHCFVDDRSMVPPRCRFGLAGATVEVLPDGSSSAMRRLVIVAPKDGWPRKLRARAFGCEEVSVELDRDDVAVDLRFLSTRVVDVVVRGDVSRAFVADVSLKKHTSNGEWKWPRRLRRVVLNDMVRFPRVSAGRYRAVHAPTGTLGPEIDVDISSRVVTTIDARGCRRVPGRVVPPDDLGSDVPEGTLVVMESGPGVAVKTPVRIDGTFSVWMRDDVVYRIRTVHATLEDRDGPVIVSDADRPREIRLPLAAPPK